MAVSFMDRKISSLKKFIDIMKSCRRQLVEDAITGNNPDLFKFLYEDKNLEIQKLYKKRYELKWLELHLMKCKEFLTTTDLSPATKREFIKIFLQWYQKFVEAWGYNSTDAFFFNAEIESLEVLIENNQRWDLELGKLENSFLRETKILDKQIEEAKIL